MEATIVCKYSCKVCGLERVAVNVPARREEDLVKWMEDVCSVALAKDHCRRRPGCRASTLSEVMIPITGAQKVGGPPVN